MVSESNKIRNSCFLNKLHQSEILLFTFKLTILLESFIVISSPHSVSMDC